MLHIMIKEEDEEFESPIIIKYPVTAKIYQKSGPPRKYKNLEEAIQKQREQTKEANSKLYLCEVCNKMLKKGGKGMHNKTKEHLKLSNRISEEEKIKEFNSEKGILKQFLLNNTPDE